MSEVIQVQALEKSFGTHRALRGIDFSVPTGSIYGFLGPNGAGKTTTITIMLGLQSKDSGAVRLFGEQVSIGMPSRLMHRIGYLPQDPVFPASLTGKEILQFVAAQYGMKSDEAAKRTRELADAFDLKGAMKRRVDGYSRGMKQRLGLAAVLLPKPELLVLDEPVSALDPEGRYEALTLLQELRGQATIFFSSHILSDVERICDTVVMIDKGRKLAESRLGDLLDKYSTEQYKLVVEEGQVEKALGLCRSLESVRQVEAKDGALYITAVHGQLDNLRRSLIPALAANDFTVVEFSLVKRDLESIFLDIVSNGRDDNNV